MRRSALHARPYPEAIRAQGRAELHRLYLVERATHVDGFAVALPGVQLGILLSHVHRAFDLLVDWVERGKQPPSGKTVAVGSEI